MRRYRCMRLGCSWEGNVLAGAPRWKSRPVWLGFAVAAIVLVSAFLWPNHGAESSAGKFVTHVFASGPSPSGPTP